MRIHVLIAAILAATVSTDTLTEPIEHYGVEFWRSRFAGSDD